MYIVYRFLRKSRIIFLTLLILLGIIATPASAAQKFGDLTIDHSPNPAKLDSGSIVFRITADRDVFGTSGEKYSYTAWLDGESKHACPSSDNPKTTTEPKEIIFNWTITGCRARPGNWHFAMWQGSTEINSAPQASILINDYPFSLEQAGGGTLQIKPVKTPLGLSETPTVRLLNARNGNWYTFWWDGSITDLAKKYQATFDGNVPSIDLNKSGIDFTQPGRKVLCMELGDHNYPAGLTCRYKAAFEFTSLPPPPPTGGTPQCSIESANGPNPVTDDSVSIKVINLPLNEVFRADLVIGGVAVNLPARQNSGNLGMVILNLDPHLGEGDYTANVYNSNNAFVCGKDFKVGPPGSAPPPSNIKNVCDPNDSAYDKAKCSSAGGDPCGNPANPGFKTAIGCIHTSPVTLTRDVLTFVAAISGGLAFLMMLLGAFQMLTSQGNPDSLNAGRERLTSAVIGLLFVIFSVLLLRVIGVDILGLGKFFGGP